MTYNFKDWCLQAYTKVTKRRPYQRAVQYQDVPKSARVTNRLSERAFFSACAMRRRGYLVRLNTCDLVAILPKKDLCQEKEATLMDAWLRGILWTPLLAKGDVSDGKWVMATIKDSDIARFLLDKERTLVLQILESSDPPATQEKLDLLKAGLFTRSGKHCPVLLAKATY